jgi:hypothetical protein
MPVERLHRYLPWALVERMKFWIISRSYSRKNHLIIPKEFLRNLDRVIRWFKSFGSHKVQKGKEVSVLYSRHSDEARSGLDIRCFVHVSNNKGMKFRWEIRIYFRQRHE